MNEREPNIRIPVDLTNPGQFFACCGLLELADRLWPGADVVAKFDLPRFDRSRFSIFSNCSINTRELVGTLLECDRTAVDPYRPIMGSNGKPVSDAKKTKPVQLKGRVTMRLSWWLDELVGRQTDFKMWAAHKTSEGLINDMATAISLDEICDKSVFESRIGMSARLGLDIRSSWNSLDEGFSPNDQSIPVETHPATEFLAAIGLQTFRPSRHNAGYVYACWTDSLPALVARAVASGAVDLSCVTRYRFDIGARGRFKFFTKAALLKRITNYG